MHDPLALAVALDPTLVETRRATVAVETAWHATGATIADWRGQWAASPTPKSPSRSTRSGFRRMFFEAMARLAGSR